LRWSDVRFDEGIIANIRSNKGKTVHHREVPLTARLKVALHDLKQKQCVSAFKVRRKSGLKPDEDLVFGISTTVKTSWQAAPSVSTMVRHQLPNSLMYEGGEERSHVNIVEFNESFRSHGREHW
jgi:hypothetical protein